MTSGGVFLFVALLSLAVLLSATLLVVVRGGRGPGDPPASHLRIDPAGFPVPSRPRGLLDEARRRRRTAVRFPAPAVPPIRRARRAAVR